MVIPLDELQRRLTSVLSPKPEIREAYLFGSTARGEAQPHSDVDVAVYVDRAHPLDQGFGYDAELASELMSALGTNHVDVVVLNRADPVLYHRVLRDGMRLFARDLSATTAREGYALSRYCDYLPQLEKIRYGFERRNKAGDFGR